MLASPFIWGDMLLPGFVFLQLLNFSVKYTKIQLQWECLIKKLSNCIRELGIRKR